LTWIFRILWFVFSFFLCKNGRGGLINVPFRLRQSGRGSSFFQIEKKSPFHAAVGEKDVVYARPCHRCSAQEHAEGSSRNGISSFISIIAQRFSICNLKPGRMALLERTVKEIIRRSQIPISSKKYGKTIAVQSRGL